jgi:hypothetical protein
MHWQVILTCAKQCSGFYQLTVAWGWPCVPKTCNNKRMYFNDTLVSKCDFNDIWNKNWVAL